MRIVMKFGGSSLASASHIHRAALRIAARRNQGDQVVAVVSAQGDATDELLERMGEITLAPPLREQDALLSCGEQMSAALLAAQLEDLGVPAVSLCGWQAGIETDAVYGSAHILRIRRSRILKELRAGRVVVVAGFQGVDEGGDITTIGRGGSDTTAVALAAALRADVCRIFTDVDGVYSADPRIVPEAIPYHAVSYEEMQTMADLGAQVLHGRAVALARKHGVSLEVCSSLSQGEEKTVICADCGRRPPIRGVVCTETEEATLASVVGMEAAGPEARAALESALEGAGIPCAEVRSGSLHLTAVLPRGMRAQAAALLHEVFFPGNGDPEKI